MTGTINQRQKTRFQPRQTIRCSDLNGIQVGRVMNLSETGFMLMTSQEAEVNDTFIYRLDLPLMPAHQITISCEVVWCQKSSFSDEYGIGIQISSIDDLANAALRRFLNNEAKASAA